jgi:hypothetical protein
MNRELIKSTIENLSKNGYQFIMSGTHNNRQIIMVKDGKGIILYKEFWSKGQQWHSHQGAFKLAEKINNKLKRDGEFFCEVTPSLMRSFIIDNCKIIQAKKIF